MHQAIDPWVTNARFINIHNASGKRILKQDLSDVIRETNYLIPRYQLVRAMYDYAKQIGVDIHLGWQVSSVRDDWGSAHIEIESSGHKHKVSGDCVICCDGVHSKSRDVVSGQSGAPRPSGYAAFRALIDGTKLADDPEARWILEGAEQTDRFEVFFAPNAQMAIQSCNKGKDITWFCIHKV
jgi:2-polyprenyl-6-methoxyphenol hydroxylase-like FAD-dependent oxidoreductase